MQPLMQPRGFTLVELMLGIVLVSILLGVALPAYFELLLRMRLEGALNELSVDLQYARSQSIRQRAAIVLTTDAAGNAYQVASASSTLKTVTLPAGVTLTPNTRVIFDALRGMAQAVSLDGVASGSQAMLRVKVNAMGRVQLCSESSGFAGYPTC